MKCIQNTKSMRLCAAPMATSRLHPACHSPRKIPKTTPTFNGFAYTKASPPQKPFPLTASAHLPEQIGNHFDDFTGGGVDQQRIVAVPHPHAAKGRHRQIKQPIRCDPIAAPPKEAG